MTSQVLDQFNKHGYIIVRNLFTFEEISKLKDHFETHEDIQKHAYGRSDGNNRMSKLCIFLNLPFVYPGSWASVMLLFPLSSHLETSKLTIRDRCRFS